METTLVVGLVCLALGATASYLVLSRKLAQVKELAQQAASSAEQLTQESIRQAEIRSKEELLQRREELDTEYEKRQAKITELEERLIRREENIEKKTEVISKKENYIETKESRISDKEKALDDKQGELESAIQEQHEQLQTVAHLSADEAKQQLLSQMKEEISDETDALIRQATKRVKEEAENEARDVITLAIQRCAAEHTSNNTVSSIDLPSDDLKGRVIGREGRNIRAFERATGVDVIVDDTPGVIVLSAFDPVRRETARRAMAELVQDGRIHPARIEDVVATAKKEMDEVIRQAGEQAAQNVDVRNLHPRIVNLLGRLKFRTSYGQNVLDHVQEVSFICGIIAAEIHADPAMGRRAGLLHDIGKAVDHEMEGGHPAIGMDIGRRCNEPPEIVNAIGAHHYDIEPTSIYAVLANAGDAISASRPGARRESFERYIKRLERLEDVATSFQGVDQAYAIQAGREVRVIVSSQKVNDKGAMTICRDIAKNIEQELTYPGEVKVTLVREMRITEYAR